MPWRVLRTIGLLFVFGTICDTADADVGQSWVMFVYRPIGHKCHLDAKQQQEIGERLVKAHRNSSGSDRHTSFICYLRDDDADVVYRITETNAKFPPWIAEAYQITARDFEAMRQAIAAVEQDFKLGGPTTRILKREPAAKRSVK